ncbi:MAG: Eco57I restriction-modification methylase domain-containing protein [Candidatus Cryosericum sp.]
MENAPDGLVQLIDRFKEHLEQYKGASYDEANTRTDFIDPLFELLGWDVANKAGYAEQYREVIREDKVSIEGGTKAPDYCFRIGGVRKFFVEAKKPSIDLRNDPSPAYQLRRYAYSAKLPLSILTDFQEFAVYDTRIKPSPNDGASAARIEYFTFEDYPGKWAFLTSTFSRDAILHGAFDKYVEDTRNKHGTGEVDKEFLKLIDQWREKLARNIALRNRNLPLHQLNFAVQKTIDRIVFLRIAEDRGIDTYGNMHALLNGTNQYTRLLQLFTQADARYNGGLFNFAEDTLTPGLTVDDNIIKDIVRSVYYPQSPYEFSVLDVAILGNIYEQFLGKTIRLTTEHRVKVEEKPEVKKAGGVYYTPRDIVEYIVDHTVGEALKETTPAKVEQLHILDPACGSGSFLLGAYDRLLSWHLDWYAQDTHCAKALKDHRIIEPRTSDYRLTIDEKRRILTNNIYGVDIDDQAVEIAKLSLTLRLLEGETSETAELFTRGGRQRLLPKLETNIKCGNSLIGPDFYSEKPESLFVDDDTRYRINAFDWKGASGFKQVFDTHGGFDVVLGNPPYIRIQALKEFNPVEVEYYKERYKAASKGNYDLYAVFVEQGLNLLNDRGRLGYILPHKFFNAQYGEPLRKLIAEGDHLKNIVHFGDQQVFDNATTYTCLLFLDAQPHNSFHIAKVTDLAAWRRDRSATEGDLPATTATSAEWNFTVGSGAALFERLSKMPVKLENVTLRIFQGIKTGADKVFIVEEVERRDDSVCVYSRATDSQHWLEPGLLHPLIKGGNSKPYSMTQGNLLVMFPYLQRSTAMSLATQQELKTGFPLTWDYLVANKELLNQREDGALNGTGWFAYSRNQALDVISLPKLFTPDIAPRASFSFDEAGDVFFTGGVAGGYGLLAAPPYSPKYLLGILNSALLDWMLKKIATSMRGAYYSFESRFIRNLPVRPIDFADPADKAMHDEMVRLVDQMLSLHRQLAATGTDREKSGLQLQIAALDRAIDSLVFQLYGLDDKSIDALVSECT